MGKHKDYTRYSNQVKTEVTPAIVEEPVEITAEEPEVVLDEVVEAVYGIVEGCKMLNVRERPSIESPIISIVAAGNVVRIVEKESTDEFYKVHVDLDNCGIDGFCMKKFIRLV